MKIIKQIFTNFMQNGGSYRAAALSYTSLLSLVPFCAVIIAVISLFPQFDAIRGPLQDLIFQNFLPKSGNTIQQYVLTFVDHVSELPKFGSLFLLITAILLLQEIEAAMNTIWQHSKARSFSHSILLYITILTIAPITVALIFLSTTLLVSSDWLGRHHYLNEFSQHVLLPLMPQFLTGALLFLFYKVLPKCKVKTSHALLGACLATICIEIGKWSFSDYLYSYHTYDILYGAFATIPIFLVWIYVVWLIVLLGAELSYALGSPDHLS